MGTWEGMQLIFLGKIGSNKKIELVDKNYYSYKN